MLFCDYHFNVDPDGTIFFDNELTSEQLGIKPGDSYVATVNADGTVKLKKIDLSKFEHIDMES